MIEKYNAVKRIPSFDVDMSSTLRPVSFLNFAQEAANIHADYLGVGYDAMHTTRKAWVLARMHVIFHKLPMWRDHVNILCHRHVNVLIGRMDVFRNRL